MDFKKALQDGISQLARKEFKTLISPYKAIIKVQNKKIDELKKQLSDLDKRKADKPDPCKLPSQRELTRKANETEIKPVQLKRLRTKFKLTQDQMAHILGVSKSTYIFWEYGKSSPRFQSKVEIIKLFSLNKRAFSKLYKDKLAIFDHKSDVSPVGEQKEQKDI